MLKLRIRPVHENGSTDETTRVIPTQDITFTGVLNAPSSLSFKASRDDWEPEEYPFVVRVEYSIGGPYAPLPEHDLFLIDRDSDDSKDAAHIVTYQGVSYVPWILAGSYVGDGPWNVDGERIIDAGPANAGRIFDYLFAESRSRVDALKHLAWTFDGSRDSANVSWQASDRDELAWRVDQHWYSGMLTQMTELGMCDWAPVGTELRLFRPGTRGVDRSDAILFGGPRFDRVPVRTDAQGQFNRVLSQFDEGRTWVEGPGTYRFGTRSVVVSHTGVKTAAQSQKLSQKLLTEGQTVKREEAYQWTPSGADVLPFRDFGLGDLVSAISRGAKRARRVVGVIITQTTESVSVQARVGEKISTLAARNQKRLDAVTGGAITGGTGGAFPTAESPVKAPPARLLGLHVVSNAGEFTQAGSRATVVLGWFAVTETVDGEEVIITEYALFEDGVEVLRTHDLTVALDVPSGVVREYRVQAFAGADRRGDLSDPVAVIGAFPDEFSLTPSGPVLTSGFGNVAARWDGGYTTPAVAGAHTVRVEARLGTSDAFVQQGAALTEAGSVSIRLGDAGDTVQVRLRAFDQLGRETGTSDVASITVQGVEYDDFDTVVKDRFDEIELTADEALAGQVRIERTVDGLNRRFTSIESPGRGFVGYENLAPPTVGSGNWVEVRRNWNTNPSFEVNLSGWAVSAAGQARSNEWSSSGDWSNKVVTSSGSALAGDVRRVLGQGDQQALIDNGVIPGESLFISAKIYTPLKHENFSDAEDSRQRRILVFWGTGAAGPWEWSYSPQAPNEPGEHLLEHTVEIPDYAERVIIAIGCAPSSSDPDFVTYVDDVYWGAPGPYFDGSSLDFTIDPDMRTRWLGAKNASESVMEAQLVDLIYPSAQILPTVFQSDLPGSPIGMRVERLTNAAIGIPITNGLPTTGTTYTITMMARSRGKDYQVIPRIRNGYNTTVDLPADEWVHIKVEHNAGTGSNTQTGLLVAQGSDNVGDVLEIAHTGLYEGTIPDDAIPFHNGDEWHQLGWSNEADEGDPTKLVIIHTWTWNGQDWVHFDIWAENVFATNSVTARVINMDEGYADKFWANEANIGRIGVDYLEPNIGDNINIQGNLVVQGIQQQQDATDANLTTVEETAGTALDHAAIADGKALAAQSLAEGIQSDLADHQQVFRVVNGVPEVAHVTGMNVLRLESARISMSQGGQVVTYWEQGQLVVNKIVVNEGQLAGHKINPDGAGGTVIQPI